MIRIGKPDRPQQIVPVPERSAWETGLKRIGKLEKRVGKWIEQNPVWSIGIALAVGIGMGLALKRRQ